MIFVKRESDISLFQFEDVDDDVRIALEDPRRVRAVAVDPVEPRERLEGEVVVGVAEGDLDYVPEHLALLLHGLHDALFFRRPHQEHGAEPGHASPGTVAPEPPDAFSRALLPRGHADEVDDVEVLLAAAELGFVDQELEREFVGRRGIAGSSPSVPFEGVEVEGERGRCVRHWHQIEDSLKREEGHGRGRQDDGQDPPQKHPAGHRRKPEACGLQEEGNTSKGNRFV